MWSHRVSAGISSSVPLLFPWKLLSSIPPFPMKLARTLVSRITPPRATGQWPDIGLRVSSSCGSLSSGFGRSPSEQNCWSIRLWRYEGLTSPPTWAQALQQSWPQLAGISRKCRLRPTGEWRRSEYRRGMVRWWGEYEYWAVPLRVRWQWHSAGVGYGSPRGGFQRLHWPGAYPASRLVFTQIDDRHGGGIANWALIQY